MNKKVKHIFIFLSLFLLCVVPMLGNIFTYSEKTVVVEHEDLQYVSIKDQVVEQKIYIEGDLKNLTIYFYAPSGSMYQNAEAILSVIQGNKEYTECVTAKRIKVESAYEQHDGMTTEEEQALRYCKFTINESYPDIQEGEALLRIRGVNLPEGTDLFCMVSKTCISGLPSASANGMGLGYPLAIEYSVLKHNQYYYFDITMILILHVAIFIVSWLLASRDAKISSGNYLYASAVVLNFICISIQSPTATFFGTPRSEAVYEFWYKAHNLTFFDNLMSLMSGEALAWLERLLMWCADAISPIKYVFVTAQIMETCFICFLTAMPCLKTFAKYFSDYERLIMSVVLGTFTLYLKTYYFWSVSYWAFVFIILFAFVDMNRLKKRNYALALLLTIILCVSRIFHIMFIPVAVLALMLIGRERGKRFRFYCYVVIVSSLFEGIYSLQAGHGLVQESGILSNIKDIGLWNVIQNTLYYEVQVINSFFTGTEHRLGLLSNIIGLSFVISVVLYSIYLLCKKDKQGRTVACVLWGLGMLSLGTIAITVITSGSYAQVQFPCNYSTDISWYSNYYQEADLHFTYAYVCLGMIIVTLLYQAKTNFVIILKENVLCEQREEVETRVANCVTLFLVASAVLFVAVNAKPRERIDYSLAPDWSAYYDVVDRESYFMPVNVIYRAAQISLEHNSKTMIYGIDDNGNGYMWKDGDEVYSFTRPYNKADIGAVSDIEYESVLSVTVKKAITNFEICYVAVFKDIDGNELLRLKQKNSAERQWIDFVLDMPLEEVYCIEFITEDGRPVYVMDAIQIGVVDYEK